MKKSFSSRWRDYRLKREKDQPLDQAIYMAMATGRLEPLLRALAIYPVYSNGQILSRGDSQFLAAYSTSLRTPVSSNASRALLPEHLDIASENTEPLGAILNPGGQFEITVEAHNLPRLRLLVAGTPTVDALTPIASETLEVAPASNEHAQLLLALPDLPLPAGQTLRTLTANFHGFNPGSWPVVFLVDTAGVPQKVPPVLREAIERELTQAILVDPSVPDWRRDLFWGYRDLLI